MTEPHPRWRRLWKGLAPFDRWLAALRAVALGGGAAWLAVHVQDHAMDPGAHRQAAALFLVFTGYSALLYLVGVPHPRRLPALYRVAMILDLTFILMLVRVTGGMTSTFYLGFYLLIALHAFYFGLATGGAVAVLASVFYLFADAWPPPLPPSDLALRLGYFFLVGLSMGGLAERERRERQRVEQLNRELRAQQEDLRTAQEHLVRSERLATVGELAAGLAHDLRNPLAGISGALHVLADGLGPSPQQKALLAEVQAQIGRMNRTLTDLLSHARPPTPQYLLMSVNDVLEESLWLLPLAPGAGIEIVRELQPDLPPLRLDPNLLHQAILNVLVNARQAMPDGGQLTVRTALRRDPLDAGPAVAIDIGDTGVGIPAEHLGRVFDPFFTTKTRGTGLGLPIAARIVEQHGGRIAVESHPGRGTTFSLTIPVPVGLEVTQDAISASRR